MSNDDRVRWDAKYRQTQHREPACPLVSSGGSGRPPSSFTAYIDHFPQAGAALDIACGTGEHSLWLADRGMVVQGVDVSPVAIDTASGAAERAGLQDVASFAIHDLDEGLPEGEPVDLVLCHLFREPALYPKLVERLAPRGILAIAVLSEVGSQGGRFRALAGELHTAFIEPAENDALVPLAADEADGIALLIAQRQAGLGGK